MADVHGGYSEVVEDLSDVLPALQRGLKAWRDERRQAILNIMCKHP